MMRDRVLDVFPIGTHLIKDFICRMGEVRTFIGEIIGFRALCWLVKM